MKKEPTQLTLPFKNPKAFVDTVLGGKVNVGSDDERYEESKLIPTVKSEKIKVENPITGKTAIVTLSREGTTDKKLGSIMLSPDATREQKLSMVAAYMFEQGKEHASFLAEIMLSKGTLVKETQTFKRQVRFDFEAFANTMSILLSDIAKGIHKDLHDGDTANEVLMHVADRLVAGSDMLSKERERITTNRLKDKGFGIYIDKHGQTYSIFDEGVDEVIMKDREQNND